MGTGGHQGWRDDATDGEGREDGRQIVGVGGVERLEPWILQETIRHLHMSVAAVLLSSAAGEGTLLKARKCSQVWCTRVSEPSV